MQLGALQFPHYPAKDFAEHHPFLQVLRGPFDRTIRNFRFTKNMYEGSSFIAAYPVERAPRMPLSGLATRAGDLARFTFKGHAGRQGAAALRAHAQLSSGDPCRCSMRGRAGRENPLMSLFESSITGNVLNDGSTTEISGITAGQLATVLTAYMPLTDTAQRTPRPSKPRSQPCRPKWPLCCPRRTSRPMPWPPGLRRRQHCSQPVQHHCPGRAAAGGGHQVHTGLRGREAGRLLQHAGALKAA